SPTTSAGATLGATSVNEARVDAEVYGISFGSFRKVGAVAEITSDADTAATVPLGASWFHAAGGDVTMTVSSANVAHAKMKQVSVGLVGISVIPVSATVDAKTIGTIDAGTATSGGLAITVDAGNDILASVDLLDVQVLGGGAGLTTDATLTQRAETTGRLTLGSGGLTASGVVAVEVSAVNPVTSYLSMTSAALIGGSSTRSKASTKSATTALIDGDILDSAGATATATATNTLIGTLNTRGGSIVDIRGVVASANVDALASTTATITGEELRVRSGGAVLVGVTAANTSSLTTDTVSGGLAGVAFGKPQARVDNPTTATLDTNVYGGASVTVEATGTNIANIAAGAIGAGVA